MKNKVQAGLLMIFLTFLGILGYNAWLRETTPLPLAAQADRGS